MSITDINLEPPIFKRLSEVLKERFESQFKSFQKIELPSSKVLSNDGKTTPLMFLVQGLRKVQKDQPYIFGPNSSPLSLAKSLIKFLIEKMVMILMPLMNRAKQYL
jgi:hypothetical protein